MDITTRAKTTELGSLIYDQNLDEITPHWIGKTSKERISNPLKTLKYQNEQIRLNFTKAKGKKKSSPNHNGKFMVSWQFKEVK